MCVRDIRFLKEQKRDIIVLLVTGDKINKRRMTKTYPLPAIRTVV